MSCDCSSELFVCFELPAHAVSANAPAMMIPRVTTPLLHRDCTVAVPRKQANRTAAGTRQTGGHARGLQVAQVSTSGLRWPSRRRSSGVVLHERPDLQSARTGTALACVSQGPNAGTVAADPPVQGTCPARGMHRTAA